MHPFGIAMALAVPLLLAAFGIVMWMNSASGPPQRRRNARQTGTPPAEDPGADW